MTSTSGTEHFKIFIYSLTCITVHTNFYNIVISSLLLAIPQKSNDIAF